MTRDKLLATQPRAANHQSLLIVVYAVGQFVWRASALVWRLAMD
jgi:hypothetical protein